MVCKSSETIKEWLAEKSIIILENEKKFLTDDYDNPVRLQSSLNLFKIAPNGGWKYPRLIRTFELVLSDHLLSIGLLFQDTLESFIIVTESFEPASTNGNWLESSTTYVDFY